MLGRLFGSKKDARERADDAFVAGDFGSARLLYLEAKRKKRSDEAELDQKIAECMRGLFDARLNEAKRYAGEGEKELAEAELNDAYEIADSDAQRDEIVAFRASMEQNALKARISEEEREQTHLAQLIESEWTDAQRDEYESYGSNFSELLLEQREGGAILEKLLAIAKEAEQPRYLHVELARAHAAEGRRQDTNDAFERFVKSVPFSEAKNLVGQARMELALRLQEDGDFAAGAAMIQTLIDAAPEHPAGYMAMGQLLRAEGALNEAAEVLLAAEEMQDDAAGRDWVLLREIGLTFAAAERDAEAIHWLEQLFEYFLVRDIKSFPFDAIATLAGLHRRGENHQRAADIYFVLAESRGHKEHGRCYLAAAECLAKAGIKDESVRLGKLAQPLLGDDAELIERASKLLNGDIDA